MTGRKHEIKEETSVNREENRGMTMIDNKIREENRGMTRRKH